MKKVLSTNQMFETLEKYIPKEIWDDMMFMGTEETIYGEIYLYKHCDTRRYINIDEEGNFYMYTGNDDETYIKIDKKSAMRHLLS